jgi:hypothetical protein
MCVGSTYNSTSAGLPWPMIESKLDGSRSMTFDASTPPKSAVATASTEKRMLKDPITNKSNKEWTREKETEDGECACALPSPAPHAEVLSSASRAEQRGTFAPDHKSPMGAQKVTK